MFTCVLSHVGLNCVHMCSVLMLDWTVFTCVLSQCWARLFSHVLCPSVGLDCVHMCSLPVLDCDHLCSDRALLYVQALVPHSITSLSVRLLVLVDGPRETETLSPLFHTLKLIKRRTLPFFFLSVPRGNLGRVLICCVP